MKRVLKILVLLVVASLAMGGIAYAAESDGGTADFPARIRAYLEDLVDDGTLSEDQAEAVAEHLAEAAPGPRFGGRGGPRGGFDGHADIAGFLGLSAEDLHSAVRDGSSLAEIATANGSSPEALIEFLVSAAAEHLQQGVDDGRITAGQMAEMLTAAEARITGMVNGEDRMGPGGPGMRPGRGGRGGPHGPGGFGDGPCGDTGAGNTST